MIYHFSTLLNLMKTLKKWLAFASTCFTNTFAAKTKKTFATSDAVFEQAKSFKLLLLAGIHNAG